MKKYAPSYADHAGSIACLVSLLAAICLVLVGFCTTDYPHAFADLILNTLPSNGSLLRWLTVR